jgi:hypothetical protein
MSRDRIKSMIEANKEADERGRGGRMFYLCENKAFDISEPAKKWITGRGEEVSLRD